MEKIKKDCFLRILLSLSYPKYFVKFLKKSILKSTVHKLTVVLKPNVVHVS